MFKYVFTSAALVSKIAFASEITDVRSLLSSRKGRRLGTCDDIQGDSYADITGWHCDGVRSLYCHCKYESKKDKKHGGHTTKWECDKQQEETCTLGTPPCKWGRCATEDQICGTSWSLDPRLQTCAQVFTLASQISQLASCREVFGDTEPVCPSTVLSYVSWANKMKDATTVQNMLAAAALDTIWFYDQLRSLVTLNTSAPGAANNTIPLNLITTDIAAYKKEFQAFSCLRNIPECSGDRPIVSTCESHCNQVTVSITDWGTKCNAVAANISGMECSPLGYVRDCDGSRSSEAGAYPGLCLAFQQMKEEFGLVSNACRLSSISFLVVAYVYGMSAV